MRCVLRGNPPTSTAPPGISQQQAEGQEIWLRLSAEVVEQPLRQQGRVVWLTPGENVYAHRAISGH
jgi:hypothetical protein